MVTGLTGNRRFHLVFQDKYLVKHGQSETSEKELLGLVFDDKYMKLFNQKTNDRIITNDITSNCYKIAIYYYVIRTNTNTS